MSRAQLDRPGAPVGLGDDDTGCTVLHVDMDAFYASCELRTRPELRGRPVIVGVDAPRSVVLAATYEARRFGVHSAMPMVVARRQCPQAIVIEPTFGLYGQVSREVMALLHEITDQIEPISLDEAFLDVSGAVRRLGGPATIGAGIRARVRAGLGITCSVGVASTKHVAKLASTRAKPDGLLVVPRDRVLDFLHPLPVRALWGVGDATAASLARLGLQTVGELAHTPPDVLRRALGKASGTHLHELAWGRDPRSVQPVREEKSVGAEETFAHDVTDPQTLRAELLRLAESVGARLRKAGVAGRTVAIKVRFEDFTTISRSRTLAEPTDVARELHAAAVALLDAAALAGRPVRLIGIRAEGIEDADRPRQLTLDEPDGGGWRRTELVLDEARARFGRDALVPARLLSGGGRETAGDPRVTDRDLAVARVDLPS